MSHNFLPSAKKEVSYCTICGCLSYKNIPSRNFLPQNSNYKLLQIDPLKIKYKPISLNFDSSLITHQNYIDNRKKGLSKIYSLSQNFFLEKTIVYQSIGIMDQIYLNNTNISTEYIEIIASICILLSLEFNDCCSKPNKANPNCKNSFNNSNEYPYVNNIKGLYQFLIKTIKNIRYWQTFCLKGLNYNLGKYSAFDYINLFFALGIVFTNEHIEIKNKYLSCLNIINIITNQHFICKYNQYIIALSTIYINFINNKYFDKKVFKYIYGVDFSKKKYKVCVNEINNMINSLNTFNYQPFFINTPYINNDNNAYDLNKIINLIKNKIINNDEIIKKYLNNEDNINRELFPKYLYIKSFNYINSSNKIELLNFDKKLLFSFNNSNNKINQILINIPNFELLKYISDKLDLIIGEMLEKIENF